MTSRSIVLGTAALLLMSGATPLHIGFSPTAAFAQQITVEAAMRGNPASLNADQLRQHIKVLRAAIDDGTLQGANRQAAQQRIKAYREALDGIIAGRQEPTQERQAEQPRQGERAQRQPDRNAEQRQAEQRKAERQAERQAQREAQRQAERQGQQEAEQRKAERQAERKAERQAERQSERQAQQEAEQLKAERQAERQADRQAQREAERQAERQAQREAEQREAARQAERQAERQAPRQAERQAPRQGQRAVERQNVDSRARAIISDSRPAADLDFPSLRQRVDENRELLGTDQLSSADRQELRRQLDEDREELRARVAARQEEQDEAREPTRSRSAERSRDSDDRSRESGDRSRRSEYRMSDRDVSRIIEERRPSDQLTERELEERVRVLSRALNGGNITVREAEVARLLIDRDREELRGRLYADRDRRRDRRRSGTYDDMFVEFEVGYRPPPVIYAAEAMPRDIQMQLVAPPLYQTQRAYSAYEIATNHEVREAMPGIEIDTLNFDFGSAEVRPEEIEKLDEIGVVIESIVAERPDEVFLIEGHTDAVGSDAANDALSQRRAQAVVDALLDYFIIDPENLQTVGLGERYLKIHTAGPEEENRRVTVRRITPLLAGRG